MEDYFYKNNSNKYRTIYLINKTHIPYWNKESRKLILDSIKCTIIKGNRKKTLKNYL